jgi:UDP-N-acetylglucosamine 2-epimerase (non-hydrolysing)
MRKILFVFGTRPEAIKLAPVILHLRGRPGLFQVRVCVTAQHRGLLDQVLEAFRIEPDHDLNLMLPGQTLFQSTSRIIGGLEPVFTAEQPDMVLVQGDTTTTFCGALAAFYQRVPVGHVEAGLRTGDLFQPFPEEANRVLTTRLASLHFAATQWAADNLAREGVDPAGIVVTGNSGIDAVLYVVRELEAGRLQGLDWEGLNAGRKLIVVTAHRRESFGEGMERICSVLAVL